jgi:hypothetical protein
MTNFLVTTIFNNIDFNLDFFNTNTNTNTAIIGTTVTILLGGFIYYKFLSNWTTLGDINDNKDIGVDDNISIAEDIIIQDDNSTIKDNLGDSISDTITTGTGSETIYQSAIETVNPGTDSDTLYHTLIQQADPGTDIHLLATKANNVLMVNQEVNTEDSTLFNCNFFNKILEWYKTDGTPSTIDTSSPISSINSSVPIDKQAKLDQLNNYLQNLDNRAPSNVTQDVIHNTDLTTSPIEDVSTYINSGNTSPNSQTSDIDLNVLTSSDVDFLSNVQSQISLINDIIPNVADSVIPSTPIDSIASVNEAVEVVTVIGQCFKWTLDIML